MKAKRFSRKKKKKKTTHSHTRKWANQFKTKHIDQGHICDTISVRVTRSQHNDPLPGDFSEFGQVYFTV